MFAKGNEYYRDQLLSFIGSKQTQTGILWGSKEEGCLIVTSGGRHGKRAGYEDIKHSDGSWTYFAQGERGDHDPKKYANKLLIGRKRSILLFSTREPSIDEVKQSGSWKKLFRFEGVFEVFDFDNHIPAEGSRKGDKLLKFHLVPAANIFDIGYSSSIQPDVQPDISLLRSKLLQINQHVSTSKTTLKEYRLRSEMVKAYALLRAKGVCEFCNKEAPFLTESNLPFLEVHHILRLADDGPDSPYNVAAICPNCHREAHYGIHKHMIKDKLLKVIQLKEAI